jgi:hypothetical protein
VLTFILILLVATVGCQTDTDKPQGEPDTDGPAEVEIRRAPIHEVQVLVAESFPEQIFVYIKGGLADSCTTFRELKTERSGNTINITVTTERSKDAICAQVYGYFEKNVALGSDFVRGESYTVNVNDATTSFDYPD